MDKLLNPDITDKERKEAITDEYGVRYTKDGLKLINVSENLETYTIKEETRVISESAFRACKTLQSIVIPKGVMKIGSMAFNGCNNLTITCKSPSFKVKDGLLYSKEGELISCFSATKDIIIPSDVTKIGSCAFEGCRCLETIEIPNSVTEIGDCVFRDCSSLQSIRIPNNVTEIRECVFCGCTSLKTIEIPNNVTEIGRKAFEGCSSLRSIEIPNSVIEIREWAFRGCSSLHTIEIPNSVTEIREWAFRGCSSLRSIEIPDSVKERDERAFEGCTSLKSVVVSRKTKVNKTYDSTFKRTTKIRKKWL